MGRDERLEKEKDAELLFENLWRNLCRLELIPVCCRVKNTFSCILYNWTHNLSKKYFSPSKQNSIYPFTFPIYTSTSPIFIHIPTYTESGTLFTHIRMLGFALRCWRKKEGARETEELSFFSLFPAFGNSSNLPYGILLNGPWHRTGNLYGTRHCHVKNGEVKASRPNVNIGVFKFGLFFLLLFLWVNGFVLWIPTLWLSCRHKELTCTVL